VRFLDSLGVIARDNQRQITNSGNRSSFATQQSYDSYFLLRACSHATITFGEFPEVEMARHTSAFGSQRFDLSRKNVFESGVVGDACQDAAVRSRAIAGRAFAFLQEAVNQFAGDVLTSAAEPPFPNTRSFPLL